MLATAHPLAQVLRLGVFEFLTIRDATMVLNCCKAFRDDADIARSVLFDGPASAFTSHWFRDCGLDWFSLNPTRFPMGYEDEASTCHHEYFDSTSSVLNSITRPQVTAQLVSLVGAFEKFILPIRPAHGQSVSGYGDNVFAVPVALSLWDQHPKRKTLKPGHVWTRRDVRLALNAVGKGLGDRFVVRDPAKSHPSLLGAHWNNIKMPNEDVRSPVCALCISRGFVADQHGAEHTDELFEFDVDEDDEEQDDIDDDMGADELCGMYIQRLKRSLLTHFKFVNRVKYDLERNEKPWFDEFCQVRVELLAGVSASGFLCGSFFVRNENP